MQVDDAQLQVFLLDAGLVPRKELERAMLAANENGEPLAETLVQSGVLGSDDMRRALSHMLGIPFVRLTKDDIDLEALVLLPEPFSRIHTAVAFSTHGDEVEIALLDIQDLAQLRAYPGLPRKILPRLTDKESMKHALLHYQKHLKEKFGALLSKEASALVASVARTEDELRRLAETHAAAGLVDALVSHALYQQATDIHLQPSESGLRVRYRVGGVLADAMSLPAHAFSALAARLKHVAGLPLVSHVPAAGRFKISLGGHAPTPDYVSVYVRTAPIMYGDSPAEKLTLQLVREGGGKRGFTLSALGLEGGVAEQVGRALSKQSGLVLVCGLAGQGKTTMLYTMLDTLTMSGKSIATVEEHISYQLPAAAQMEINGSLGLSAAACLRAHMRQDADVIMLDCALDAETVMLAMHAAHRGALVLLGVEAATAAAGVSELHSLGIEPETLASVLTLSVATRLVPKLCAHSKEAYRLSRAEQNILEQGTDIKGVLAALKDTRVLGAHAAWKDVPLYTPAACAECTDGYQGMIGLQEVEPAAAEGPYTYKEDALYKAVQGLVGVLELLDVAQE